jgi:hypothetical protein
MTRLSCLLFVWGIGLFAPTLSAQAVATPDDIDRLQGAAWTGTLTYRDYSTDARTSIKSGLRLDRLAAAASGEARWALRISYADEPHANSADTITLATTGRIFRGASVTERAVLPDGRVRIVTEEDGTDNDRPARIRLVYLVGPRTASIQKLVRYGDAAYFERHIYEWTR